MPFALKRVYDPPAKSDGTRVLVDRLWPRGLTKEKAELDEWLKELGPSTVLRKWFGHEPARWTEFLRRYFRELDANAELVTHLRALGRRGRVTLLFGARNPDQNQAVALLKYLDR